MVIFTKRQQKRVMTSGFTSVKENGHLAIPLAKSCKYLCVYIQNFIKLDKVPSGAHIPPTSATASF